LRGLKDLEVELLVETREITSNSSAMFIITR